MPLAQIQKESLACKFLDVGDNNAGPMYFEFMRLYGDLDPSSIRKYSVSDNARRLVGTLSQL